MREINMRGLMGLMGLFGGIEIYQSAYLPRFTMEQFRFPRSKGKRIRKKWRKRPENWRQKELDHVLRIGSALLMRPDQVEALRRSNLWRETP